ncbi:MAG: hypothetical protein ABIJ43_02925 [Candidatus Beckwithbacteria bacterium]|nr:hypothetical protein [Patescibacteria group bacterium]
MNKSINIFSHMKTNQSQPRHTIQKPSFYKFFAPNSYGLKLQGLVGSELSVPTPGVKEVHTPGVLSLSSPKSNFLKFRTLRSRWFRTLPCRQAGFRSFSSEPSILKPILSSPSNPITYLPIPGTHPTKLLINKL